MQAATLPRYRKPCGNRFFMDELREQWARFIEWACTRKSVDAWFGTLTFKGFINERAADRLSRRYFGRLDQSLGDKGCSRLKWVRVAEWQARGVVHYHFILLAGGLNLCSRKSAEAMWSRMEGGFCRIYNAEKGAAPYLAKYLNKGCGVANLTLGGTWREWQCPKSVARVSSESVVQLPDGFK